MRTSLLLGLLGLWLIPLGQIAAQEQDKEAKAILDKAIKAMGGAEKLNKNTAASIKAKGTVYIMNMELPIAGDFAVQFPDKLRQNVEVEIKNVKITNIQVYDGKKAWVRLMDKTKEIDDDKLLTEFREGLHAQRVAGLHKIDKNFGLSLVGDAKVKGKAAVAVRVSFKDRRDVNLFFDKEKHVLLKAEYRALDPTTMKEVTREEFYSEHKEVGGILTPHRITVLHDGERFVEFEVTEMRYLDRHDDAMFAKP